jgi:hypothetical protein
MNKPPANPTSMLRTGAAMVAVSGLLFFSGGPVQVSAQELDINAVFWCNEGEPTGSQSPEECAAARNLVLTGCTACHTFVPVVKARKDEDAWNTTLNAHRARLPTMSDADYEAIGVFLKAHYNPENEPPKLPPELEALADIPQ